MEKRINIFKRRSNLVKKARSETITHVVVFCIYLFFAFCYCYMLFWALMSCLKTHREIILYPFALPKVAQWKNFKEMLELFRFNGTSFWGMTWNSIWHSVGCTLVQVWTCGSAAYVVSKYKFPGQKLFIPIIMFVLIFPIYGSSGAGYRLIFNLGLDNSPLIMLTCGGIASWNFMYYQAFFSNLSWSYAEAAYIDGANDWQIYYKIMLPQSIGIFGALALTYWVSAWTEYSSIIIYMKDMPTLTAGIYYFENEMVYHARMDILLCACFVSMVPIFALYITFNNVLFKNISLGGIKM